jgi:hypothetical protein
VLAGSTASPRIDEHSWQMRYTPPGEHMGAVNLRRMEELKARAGSPAGLAAPDGATRNSRNATRPHVRLDPGYEQRFRADEAARAWFEEAKPQSRGVVVMSAVKAEPGRRLATLPFRGAGRSSR